MQIVVDSLSRNGTTILSAILNSNSDSFCYRGCFHEPLALSGYNLNWPDSLINQDLIDKSAEVYQASQLMSFLKITNKSDSELFKKMYFTKRKKTYSLDLSNYISQSLQKLELNSQFQSLSLEEWKDLINIILLNGKNKNILLRIDKFLEEVRTRHGVSTACWRWNNAVCYFHQWTKRKDHYWLQITRDPVQAAISRKKIWGISTSRSLQWSIAYSNAFENIKSSKYFKNIYFEELLDFSNNKILDELQLFLSLKTPIKRTNLIGQDGLTYRKETSELKNRKKGQKSSAVEPQLVNKYLDSPEYIDVWNKFKPKLESTELYKRYFFK